MKNYNFIQRLLHDLLLKTNFMKKSLYEIEKKIFLDKNNRVDENKHVFISGLPRSGTTSLLNFLYNSNNFTSLTYEHMPFVLSPNLFSKIKINDNFEKIERPHKDGIFYDLKSPESFDEIFFSTFTEKLIEDELVNFISLVLMKKKNKRYLSKNNLNYKRIDLIQKILPNSFFLITYRDPLQHAFSLYNQNLNFIEIQKKDDFARRYMNYLGHQEFGNNHKPWNKSNLYYDVNTLNYWLEQWLIFYKDIVKNHVNRKNLYFLRCESFTDNDYANRIMDKLEINKKPLPQFKTSNKKIKLNYDKDLHNMTKEIYNKFDDFKKNII